MDNFQVNADALIQEGMQIAADLTKRCMILQGQNGILVQQIQGLQEEIRKLKEPDSKVVPISDKK